MKQHHTRIPYGTAKSICHNNICLSSLSHLSAAALVAALSAAAWIELPTPAAPSTSPLRANTALALTSGSGCFRCFATAATDSGSTDTTLSPGMGNEKEATRWGWVGSDASDAIHHARPTTLERNINVKRELLVFFGVSSIILQYYSSAADSPLTKVGGELKYRVGRQLPRKYLQHEHQHRKTPQRIPQGTR